MGAGGERVLGQRQLNRAVLARQQLLHRSDCSLPQALDRMAGLQAQYAPSMYVGLWSRVHGFVRPDLTAALERRQVVQGTLMRSTIHLVSATDYWPCAIAVREARRRWWLRTVRQRPSEAELAAAGERLRRRLADGPVTRKEIDAIVGAPQASAIHLWLDLVRVPPSGTWERRRADLYAAAEEWLGPADMTADAAIEHLVSRYLGGFGPAARRDIADWAGLPVTPVTEALARMDVRRFRNEQGTELVDLPAGPLPDPRRPAPVRFLPTWDATLLVHARRAGILPEEYRPRIFTSKNPHSVATFLVDGSVAGSWRYEEGRVRLQPFQRLDRAVSRQLREAAAALADLHQ